MDEQVPLHATAIDGPVYLPAKPQVKQISASLEDGRVGKFIRLHASLNQIPVGEERIGSLAVPNVGRDQKVPLDDLRAVGEKGDAMGVRQEAQIGIKRGQLWENTRVVVETESEGKSMELPAMS